MADDDEELFRQKAIDRMAHPDELTDYLKVTNSGVWAVLIAIVVLLAGVLAWACVGTLPTKASAKAIVQNSTAAVLVTEPYVAGEGMPVTIANQESRIGRTATDEYGKTVGFCDVDLPDGTYDGTVVVDETRAIDFLLKSN
jgi:hypothetical protein